MTAKPTTQITRPVIALQAVRVHNLRSISLELPLGRLILVTGVSGSGKSSLAFDTLFAEGQRRYIESFSTYARQFLDRLEKPDADRIDNIPPAIAVRQNSAGTGRKATVATATEIHEYLRLLFARVGEIVCPGCGRVIRGDAPDDVLRVIEGFADGTRFQVCFPVFDRTGLSESGSTAGGNSEEVPRTLRVSGALSDPSSEPGGDDLAAQLKEAGFTRVIVDGETRELSGDSAAQKIPGISENPRDQIDDAAWVVVDRLQAGKTTAERIVDSLEIAFRQGEDRCVVLEAAGVSAPDTSSVRGTGSTGATAGARPDEGSAARQNRTLRVRLQVAAVDGRDWIVHRFNRRLRCDPCGREFDAPEPRLFSFNSPLGACPECRGFGTVPAISFERLVPDPSKSLRDGAIAAWTTPAYRHELDELLELADDYGIPVDVPFSQLGPEPLRLITEGVPERNFGGLRGFFRWLERHKYKLSVRVFLNRWRAYETCPACDGERLQPNALAVRVGGLNIAELARLPLVETIGFFDRLEGSLTGTNRDCNVRSGPRHPWKPIEQLVRQASARLRYLVDVGLAYLTLNRPVRTLSGGEARRVALTAALGSSLVNTLYVLDEPSAGLHPRDVDRLIAAVRRLRNAGNTVVVVEHDEEFIRAADEVIDIGPGAGREGGRVVYRGPPSAIGDAPESVTGAFLSGRSEIAVPPPERRRKPDGGETILEGARHRNLKNLTVRFPLGLLCVVTGVSGSGKSTLVRETLYPALCRHLGRPRPISEPGEFDRITVPAGIDDVVLVDPDPTSRTRRSNPVTYLKSFDVIRKVFAETRDARLRNFSPTMFSFNAARGGRCPKCRGSGTIEVDMQFLADISMTCPECHGRRYRQDVLEVKYRGRTIADVLEMTVAEAFTFFRTQPKLLKRLNFLKEVGLDYLPLGQPATTLSGGEMQRLKLAAFLAAHRTKRSGGARSQARTLFLIDEPTTGLHAADVARLLDCFARLLSVGHSLIVIEHNLDVIKSADHVIDLGPEAADAGGRIVAEGTPEQIAAVSESTTGRYLRSVGVTPADADSHPRPLSQRERGEGSIRQNH